MVISVNYKLANKKAVGPGSQLFSAKNEEVMGLPTRQ
jgi:hypothetical protein